MNETDSPSIPSENKPALSLAIASLVMGLLAVVLSLFVVGALLGFVGLLLGVAYLRKKPVARGMAWWGVGLSALGIIVGTGLGVVYYKGYKHFQEMMAQSGSDSVPLTSWEGVSAPDITVTTLEGKTFKLSELKGKRVVLDFWATWCPPCVKEIPHFIQIVDETSPDDLIIIGISNEDRTKLEPFVRKMKIDYPIVSASDLPSPYSDVSAIPTTFFIDRKGVIQWVVTGYHDLKSLREKAIASDYEGEPKSAPVEAIESDLKERSPQMKAIEAWNKRVADGQGLSSADWDDDGEEEVLVTSGKQLLVFGRKGESKGVVPLPGEYTLIEAGRHKDGLRLLGYSNWGKQVTVMDKKGKELWTYPSTFGIDGAHWGDLDGDGTDEMIVGMNGGGGLHAVSAEGKTLWKYSKIGNVWNQAIIPARSNSPTTIFATEAGGTIKVFDSKGSLTRTLRPQNKYFSRISAARVDEAGTIQCIAMDEITVALSATGEIAWSMAAKKDSGSWRASSFAFGDIDQDGRGDWAFPDASGELVIVSTEGEQLSRLENQKGSDGFTMVSGKGKDILVVLKNGSLKAFRFE